MVSRRAQVASLQSRASALRDSLSRSKAVSEEMLTILGTFDERLSALEKAMAPIQERTLNFRKIHANIDATMKEVEEKLSPFDVAGQVEQRIKDGPRSGLEAYLSAVDSLSSALSFFASHPHYHSSGEAEGKAKVLMKQAMGMLEADFRQLLANNSKPMDPARLLAALPNSSQLPPTPSPRSSSAQSQHEKDPNKEVAADAAPSSALPPLLLPSLVERLNAVATRMVRNGAAGPCTRVYREVRGSSLEASLRRLGVERLSAEDIGAMPWEDLENKIGGWIQYVKVVITLVLPAERSLCSSVFLALDPHGDITFTEVADSALALLLSFGEAIVGSAKSPEKLFVLLDMYETVRDIMPQANVSLSGRPCFPLREMLLSLQRGLAFISRETFAEFEDAVEKDSTKTPVSDGTVHPLTSYVINYVKFLFDYEGTLRELFEAAESERAALLPEAQPAKPRLAVATLRILSVLESNLEAKAKLYKDPALTQLFLMNNKHYIVRSVRKSEQARALVGEDWIGRHRRVVQQHQETYQKLAWSKVQMIILPSNDSVTKYTMKDKFKSFNSAFEDAHGKACQWTIPDPELQRGVKTAVGDMILPLYRQFVAKFSPVIESTKNNQKYFKYQPKDVERMMGDMFDGRAAA